MIFFAFGSAWSTTANIQPPIFLVIYTKEVFDRAMLVIARLRWVIFFEISSYCDFYYVYIMGVTRQGIRINVGRDILPYVD